MEGLDLAGLTIGLLGGLALFLYGMDKMTDALKLTAGARLKGALARMTKGRLRAAATGALVTAVIQSSSVTSVLVVGFVSAGLLSLAAAIGVIMGANVGTTVTAQIVAFKVTKYALVLVAAGFGVSFLAKSKRTRHYGHMIMGLGLVFFGMELMSDATRPLRTFQPFIDAMGRMESPGPAILAAAGFTALIQSSSATTGVVIVLAAQGFISLEAGILLIFGANIGTCVTALLSSVGKSREAVQAAAVHVIFNVMGVVLWVFFVDYLADAVRSISPVSHGLTGVDKLGAETPRQIANAHTLFNVANTLIFIWFTAPMAWVVQRIIPERKAEDEAVVQPRYLDDILLDTPTLALDRVRMELRRLGERAHAMVEASLDVTLNGDDEALVALAARDDEVDSLHSSIIAYLGRLSLRNLDPRHAATLSVFMAAANQIENIGDMVETNLVEVGRHRLAHGITPSQETSDRLSELHRGVTSALQLALEALDAKDGDMAQQVVDMKPRLKHALRAAEEHLERRLIAEEGDRIPLFKLETEIIEYLRRVYYFAKRVAKGVITDNGRARRL